MNVENIICSIHAILNWSEYGELDTVERVVVPILRLILGHDFDTATSRKFVRFSPSNRGEGQLFDLNFFKNEKLILGIECKRCGVRFLSQLEPDQLWEPCVDKNILKARGKDWTNKSEWHAWLKKRLVRKGHDTSTVDNLLSVADALYVDGAQNCATWKLSGVSGDQKKWLTRLSAISFAESTNPADIIGQIWRYGNDGLHFVDGHRVKIVWTNGLQWLFFNDSFFSSEKWPRVSAANLGEYATIVDLPEINKDLSLESQITAECKDAWCSSIEILKCEFEKVLS